MILIIIMYMLFASTFTLGKAALDYIPFLLFVGIRMTSGGLLLLGYHYLYGDRKISVAPIDRPLFAQIILFHIYIAYTCEFWSLQYVTSAKACLLFNLSPFITAFFSYLFLSERLTEKQWGGIILGFCGMFVLFDTNVASESVAGAIGAISAPELVLLAAVSSSAYGWTVFKRLMKRGYPITLINGIGMLGGGILALISARVMNHDLLSFYQIDGWQDSLGHIIVYTALLILISNIICYNLYGMLLKRYSPTFLSFAGFMTPLFAAAFGWFFRGEVVAWNFFVALGMLCVGLYLFHRDHLYIKKTKRPV